VVNPPRIPDKSYNGGRGVNIFEIGFFVNIKIYESAEIEWARCVKTPRCIVGGNGDITLMYP
jgi:hypothetical protein